MKKNCHRYRNMSYGEITDQKFVDIKNETASQSFETSIGFHVGTVTQYCAVPLAIVLNCFRNNKRMLQEIFPSQILHVSILLILGTHVFFDNLQRAFRMGTNKLIHKMFLKQGSKYIFQKQISLLNYIMCQKPSADRKRLRSDFLTFVSRRLLLFLHLAVSLHVIALKRINHSSGL